MGNLTSYLEENKEKYKYWLGLEVTGCDSRAHFGSLSKEDEACGCWSLRKLMAMHLHSGTCVGRETCKLSDHISHDNISQLSGPNYDEVVTCNH